MTIEEKDPMLTKVDVQSLREMGYDDKKIKLAIEKLKRQGYTNSIIKTTELNKFIILIDNDLEQ